MNLYSIEFNTVSYGNGVAVVSACTVDEAVNTLKNLGRFNGTPEVYLITNEVLISQHSFFTIPTLISEKMSDPTFYKGDKGDKGDDGKSAYTIWIELGHSGTEQDFINWLASPATAAKSQIDTYIAQFNAQTASWSTNESLRITAESARRTAETARQTAETSRVSAETKREKDCADTIKNMEDTVEETLEELKDDIVFRDETEQVDKPEFPLLKYSAQSLTDAQIAQVYSNLKIVEITDAEIDSMFTS